jgi:hypothetical protein
MKISVSQFKGTVPKIDTRLVKENYSQSSTNTDLHSGALLPINGGKLEVNLGQSGSYNSIYKYYINEITSRWLTFNENVFLVKDPIADNIYNRTIITGLDKPRIFDVNSLGDATEITADTSYILGLPTPADSGFIQVTGSGLGLPESRAYTYAYAREWLDTKRDDGPWAGPAYSSSTLRYVDVRPDQSVIYSGIKDAPDGYGITHVIIYRTAVGTQDAAYRYVSMFNISDAKAGTVSGVSWNSDTETFTYTDSKSTEQLGEVAMTMHWDTAPDNLDNILSLYTGVLVGTSDNNIYVSEPYQMHAWPDYNRVPIEGNIVGLGAFGNNIVVCTDANPYIITINNGIVASIQKINDSYPCLYRESIVSFKDFVLFYTEDGFIKVSSSGILNITEPIFNRKNFYNMNIVDMFCTHQGDIYYCFYLNSRGQRKALFFDTADVSEGICYIDINCTAAYLDLKSNILYLCKRLPSFDWVIAPHNTDNNPFKYIWKSKKFLVKDDTLNFSCARVRFTPFETRGSDFTGYTNPELIAGFNTRPLNYYPVNGPGYIQISSYAYVIFNWYIDGELVFSKNVLNSKPFRLPAGKVGSTYEFELMGYSPIYTVDIATSMSELEYNYGGTISGN